MNKEPLQQNDLKHLEELRKECLESGDNLQAFEITIKINKLKKEIIAGRADA